MKTMFQFNYGVAPRYAVSALLCVILIFVLTGCKKETPAAPEKALVRTTVVESMENVRSDSEASYLAMIRAEKETDLSFKVGGIVDIIGPAPGTDWDEGTPVRAGTVLAELKQADFVNALNSARARADLMEKEIERIGRFGRGMQSRSRSSMSKRPTGARQTRNWTRRNRISAIRGWSLPETVLYWRVTSTRMSP